MQFELMQADLEARRTDVLTAGTGELDYAAVNEIHSAAFDAVGLPPEAFSLYTPLSQRGEISPAQAQALFVSAIPGEDMIDVIRDGLLLGVGGHIDSRQSLAQMLEDYGAQAQWLKHVAAALIDFESIYPHPEEPVYDEFLDLLDQYESLAAIAGYDFEGLAGLADWIPSVLDWGDENPAVQGTPAFEIPSWLPDALTPWNSAPTTSSPLTLDLDSDGVELTTFNATTTTTTFDIDGDGFAEQTAWLGADDGLLARDLDESGTIDSVAELFGSPGVDGFALLAQLDDNGDHVINQYDDAWSDLVVWKDADGDAVTDTGELHSLASLGIVSFDLAGVTASTSTISGNPISHTSTYTLSGGTTRTIADAWFVHSNVNTAYAEDYTLDVRTLFLPTLRGFGEVADLHIAMSQDEDLLELVHEFALNWDISRFEDGASLDADVQDILWTWAGVEGVSSGSRGGYIDARKLEFLEKFFGQGFTQESGGSNPYANSAALLEEAWQRVFYAFKAQLMVQAGAGVLFDNTIVYNAFTGELAGDMDLSQSAIDDLEAAAPSPGASLQHYWEQIAEFIAFTKGFTNLGGGEETMIADAIGDTDPTLSFTSIQYTAVPSWVGISYPGSADDDTISGTSGADSLNGNAGNDTISGNDGNDTISGGTGNDVLYGNDGDDIISGNDGNDTLHAGAGTNTLYGNAGDDTLNGYTGADTLEGGDGNDTLDGHSGNDILKPGAGGNTVYGGDGNDTYYYAGGTDFYSEDGKSGTDTIILPPGITSGHITFSRVEDNSTGISNIFIQIGSLGTIEAPLFYYGRSFSFDRIESLTFADTSTYNFTSITALETLGTTGNDYIRGVLTSSEVNDTIHGLAGADELLGEGGNDILDGGIGNDTLRGGDDNDIYLASAGFDVIYESSGTDILRLPSGYDSGDVSYLRINSAPNDLLITIEGLGQVLIKGQFSSSSNRIETLDFNGSSAVTLTSLSIETRGTTGNDTIDGISSGASTADIIDGGAGNDTLRGDWGNDVYFFSTGADEIQEASGSDTLKFREGVTPGSVSIYRDGNANQSKNLVLDDGNGNKTAIKNHFSSSGSSLESIIFHDATTWTVSSMEIETRGTSGADTIYAMTLGDASQDDTIYGYAGNDTIEGGGGNDWINAGDGDDSVDGGSGNDTYVYTAGLDSISENNGTDALIISGGATINDVSVADYSTFATKVIVNSGTDEVTLNAFRVGSYAEIENIRFDDGFSTNLVSYNSWIKGASGADTVNGNSSANTLIGYAGNDTINAGSGNDDAHGGAGNDTLYGDGGADLLHGGVGDDTLYGGDGLDTLYGGSGADTFKFQTASAFNNVDVIKDFSTAANDVIDLIDILGTVYDPLNDAISDFVSKSESSGSTFLSVDRDGTGGVYSMVQIAKLEGVTDLASIDTLESNGRLIAA